MSSHSFDLAFGQLPGSIPVFPLTGVLLLPEGRLPLNIFEPRYLNMVLDALATPRLIGMIQPAASPAAGEDMPALYRTGCAGRITSFSETEDGRLLITLTGICRFHVASELPLLRGYRRVVPDWSPFRADLEPAAVAEGGLLDRSRLDPALRAYFQQQGIDANWDAIHQAPDDRLVTSLAMICPFDATEKQALLEAPDQGQRAQMLLALIEMAVHDKGNDGDSMRH